jgi:TrmH family RNA methyltransferase
VYAEPGAPADVVDAARAAGVPVRAVAAGVLGKVTSPVTPQPMAALAALPDPPGDEVLRGLVLALVAVADPGNAGTLLRVAEAAGATALVSCADAVDLWNPKAVRASAGSIFRVPVLVEDSAHDAVGRLRAAGMTTLATTLDGADVYGVDLRGDVAVLLGNEAHGLPPELVEQADLAVRIPMAGRVESLNVAMTGTVVAFEAARQRQAGR